jgi:hypothetical protein
VVNAADIIVGRPTARAQSSPQTGLGEKEIGDIAQKPQRRPAGSTRSSGSVSRARNDNKSG